MTIKPLIAAALLATSAFAAPALAGDHKKKDTAVMGAMETGPNIVETAVSVDDLSTLVAAVKAADLVDALSGDGPFTVFAPTNDAFGALPAGTVDTLLKPENKAKLSKVLTSHVVAGSFDAASIIEMAEANGGKAKLTTLSGATLKAYVKDGNVYVKDEMGGKGKVAMADVTTSNGTVHVVTSVLLPK
ncbi:fasciclin domain-containing protein [Algimonas porphyrae]|uniref:Fasciclin n=1 Tax=Algimonas porphyrae TaxID=1128113 RepID=A0ABQ5V537_9PROT|nr:fasciclin domain-containing protein [Algimonas porphyrae]GLQ22074.1 fasciclin [Algimonas porphyrae]